MMKEEDLLKALKNNLLNVEDSISDNDEYFGKDGKDSEKESKYYLRKLKYNLYEFEEPEFELGKDADAIRSSAAMIYNTIGSESIKIDGNDYKLIKYEDELSGLKGRTGPHLDVTLFSEQKNERLFIEAKCLEWLSFSSADKLKSSYLNKQNYRSEEEGDFFISIFKMLINDSEKNQESYSSVYNHYNSKQMTIHILGIYHWCLDHIDSLPKSVKLMNIVWDCGEATEYLIEESEGLEYVAFANLAFRNVFKKLGVEEFKVEYVPYSEFLDRVDWSSCEKRRNYLRRYDKSFMKSNILNIGLEETVKGYNNETFSLSELRASSNRYRWNDPYIMETKIKHESIYNNLNERIPLDLVKKVYGVNDDFMEIWEKVSWNTRVPYCVSNLGRIAKYEKEEKGVFIGKEILLQTDIKDKKGYLVISYDNNQEGLNHTTCIYEFIANAFFGDKKDKQIHHIDNNGYDCRPDNLILLTPRQHSKVHGFYVTGDDEEIIK